MFLGFVTDGVIERSHVEEANKLAPAFGRIFKEMIIVTHPDKPMGRAGKGTVLRKQTLGNYAKEIEQLYGPVFRPPSITLR